MTDQADLTEDNLSKWSAIAKESVMDVSKVNPREKQLLEEDIKKLNLPPEEFLPDSNTESSSKMSFRETPRLYPATTPEHERVQQKRTSTSPAAATLRSRQTPSSQSKGAKPRHSSKGKQDDPTPVLEQKVKNRLEKDEQEKERIRAKIGVTAHPYYTVPKDWKEILKGEGPNGEKYREALEALWSSDKWEHLENPPASLSVEDFIGILPRRMPNSIFKASVAVAQINLFVAKYKAKDDSVTLRHVLEQGPLMSDHMMATAVSQLENTSTRLVDVAQYIEAAQKEAHENLAQTEKQLIGHAYTLKAHTTDFTHSFGQKADQISSAIEGMTKKKDTETGSLMSASWAGSGINLDKSASTYSSRPPSVTPPASVPKLQKGGFV